jgi:hypothetical protein
LTSDLVFTVANAEASLLPTVTLADAGLKERQHLQEWVRKNPAILGDGIMVVTFEFDKWVHGGTSVSDRLDILALENTGRLVVVELKRGVAPDTTDMQAIKYAAMTSEFTFDALAQHHATYLTKPGESQVSTEDAKQLLYQHVGSNEETTFAPLLDRPRIILIANGFPPSVTSTAVFLSKFGLDIALLEFQAYKTPSNEFILTLNKVFPIEGIKSLQIQPRIFEEAEKEAVKIAYERRQKNAVLRILEEHAIANGEEFTFIPPPAWAERLKEYLAKSEDLSKAKWDERNPAKTLIWEHDQKSYSPSGLCKKIMEESEQIPISVQGTTWWQTKDAKTILDIAEEIEEDR